MAWGLEIGVCQLWSQLVLAVNYLEPYGMAQKHYVYAHTQLDFIFIFQQPQPFFLKTKFWEIVGASYF